MKDVPVLLSTTLSESFLPVVGAAGGALAAAVKAGSKWLPREWSLCINLN